MSDVELLEELKSQGYKTWLEFYEAMQALKVDQVLQEQTFLLFSSPNLSRMPF